MSVVYGAPSSMYPNAAGVAIGMPVQNGTVVGITAISSKKADDFHTIIDSLESSGSSTRMSDTSSELGLDYSDATLNDYLDGKGIVTGISGGLSDAFTYGQTNPSASVVGDKDNWIEISGIAFYQVVTPSEGGTCETLYGHGISGIIDYFIDHRMSAWQGSPVAVLINLGRNTLLCGLIAVDFQTTSLGGDTPPMWTWNLKFVVHPELQDDIN